MKTKFVIDIPGNSSIVLTEEGAIELRDHLIKLLPLDPASCYSDSIKNSKNPFPSLQPLVSPYPPHIPDSTGTPYPSHPYITCSNSSPKMELPETKNTSLYAGLWPFKSNQTV